MLGACAAAATVPHKLLFAQTQRRGPNVLFIAIDDLNDWVGCLGGHPDTITPNIDALANEGVVFTNAHCNSPACCPSRTSLLSGIRTSTSGVYFNGQDWRPLILPIATTLPRHFRNHGYRVTCSGKIFHAYDEPDLWHALYRQGLDKEVTAPLNPWNGMPYERKSEFVWGPMDCKPGDLRDTKTLNWAIQELSNPQPRPFFLSVGFRKPHLKNIAPRFNFEKFDPENITLPIINENDLDDIPLAGQALVLRRFLIDTRNYKLYRQAVVGYLATVNYIDDLVGRLLDTLYSSPYVNDTIVVLWSDNGFHLGEKLHWQKMTLWEESTRVPLIFTGPGVLLRGIRCNEPVSLLDTYPTLIELCELGPVPQTLEGESLTPLLRAPHFQRTTPAVTTYGPNNHAIRSKRWRYIRYADGSEELYDHVADPYEWNNLALDPSYYEIKEQLARWLPAYNAPYPPADAGSG